MRSINSGDASRVPLHFGYLLQPRKNPCRPSRSFIGEPHSSHTSVMSTFGISFFGGGGGRTSFSFSFNSSDSGFELRHFGYALHARNGPRGPLRTIIADPHFSHVTPVSIGLIGLPCASTSFALRHFGSPRPA